MHAGKYFFLLHIHLVNMLLFVVVLLFLRVVAFLNQEMNCQQTKHDLSRLLYLFCHFVIHLHCQKILLCGKIIVCLLSIVLGIIVACTRYDWCLILQFQLLVDGETKNHCARQ